MTTRQLPPPIEKFAHRYLGRALFSSPGRPPKVSLDNIRNRNQWVNYIDDGTKQELSATPVTGLVFGRLSEADIIGVIANAKKKQVTVSSFLIAATSVAMHQMLPSEEMEVLTLLHGDFRRFAAEVGHAGPDVIQHVALLSVGFWKHPIMLRISDDTDIWQLAHLCQQQVQDGSTLANVFETLSVKKGVHSTVVIICLCLWLLL